MVNDADAHTSRAIFYGRLERILEVTIPDQDFWGDYKDKTVLLALITPCKTKGTDATKILTTYTMMTAQIIVDLQAISSVVGRIKSRNTWTIIDRSTEYARTEFIPPDDQRIGDVDD